MIGWGERLPESMRDVDVRRVTESKAGRDSELGSAYQFESDETEMPPVG